MDLNFYSDLMDGTGQHGDPEFLDPGSFNGFDNKFPGGSDNFLTISGASHPFLSSSETFHTPSLGDEEFEIPPISLDPDQALTVSDVVAHFGELSDGERGGLSTPGNAVVGGDDPSFAMTFVNPHSGSQGLEHHLSLGVISQPGGGAMLGSALGMDLGHPIGSQFSSSSPMTIDVPLNDMGHGLLGHNQLTTMDQTEFSAQLGLSLGGGAILACSQSPDQPLSAAASPVGSLQDDDMDDFRRQSVLVESPVSLGVISLDPSLSDSPIPSSAPSFSTPPTLVRRGGAVGGGGGGKKGKRRKDPNEPQKPVSAYALFFRDTQAAIKGQNPNATFGEVSKIVASMWESLGEEQKQVYTRKTEAAKTGDLKALAAYRDNQLPEPTIELLDTALSPPSPPSPALLPTPVAPIPAPPVPPPPPGPEENTITNICTSNIILTGGDLPQVTTRSRTGAHKPPAPAPSPPTVTKIIIKQQKSPSGVTVVSSSTVLSSRQPPPLQQMQNTPPPPRLQQMVHAQAPPPLQAKPRGGGAGGATAPPPLQIKMVHPSDLDSPIIVTAAGGLAAAGGFNPNSGKVVQSSAIVMACSTEAEDGAEGEEGMQVELNVSSGPVVTQASSPNLCVRAGCTNPAVENRDWDREYCSNECVATHCRDVFMAWCAIRGQKSTSVT
ncbi:TOX high mobility group box family member 4b isoform X1 [Oncorhynchus tshawytscha]|uniref:TOX high mobility group box family member 4b isoform X1 n=1 Tax=Oncorhynchus tshawytscha TaxID=74940 RepID=UPI001C3DCDE9|nr:TOX high mobility group box family member 4b isoform X1 [Oncorhynchus tshawytscha]